MPLTDHFLQLRAEATIVEHLDVGREDGGRILAELLGNPHAMPFDFGSGRFEGFIEAFELVLDRIAREEPPRDAKSLVVHDKHFADRHAGRYGNPLQTFHVVSRFDSSLQSATRSPLGGSSLFLFEPN